MDFQMVPMPDANRFQPENMPLEKAAEILNSCKEYWARVSGDVVEWGPHQQVWMDDGWRDISTFTEDEEQARKAVEDQLREMVEYADASWQKY